jgi:predicted nucleotidyltransferase
MNPKIPKKTQEKIQKIADKIAAEYKPEKIILFGSYAWGKPHRDSDLDFLIVKKTDDSAIKRSMDVDRLFFPREFAMDFLVYTPDQIEQRQKIGDPFMAAISNKGKILYAK